MFDPYSFTHVLHGIIFQPIISHFTKSIPGGLLSCLLLELGWEVLENSPAVMRRFRANSGTSGQYHGDSVQNIIGDLVSCGAGYVVATLLDRCGLGLARVGWVAVSEVCCVLYMRDSLVLTIFSLCYRSEVLAAWQERGIPRSLARAQDKKE